MKLIVGLGNPGREYANTRHNLGNLLVQTLGRSSGLNFRRDSGVYSFIARGTSCGRDVVLVLPYTYMNLSGRAVKAAAAKYGKGGHELLVACDDMDFDLGTVRLKRGGSSGGHKGIGSVIESLGNGDFCRLRLGIGRPPAGVDAAAYVLEKFSPFEKNALPGILETAEECCKAWLTEGTDKAMSRFNAAGRDNGKNRKGARQDE